MKKVVAVLLTASAFMTGSALAQENTFAKKRSMTRTWTGISMIAGGAVLATLKETASCNNPRYLFGVNLGFCSAPEWAARKFDRQDFLRDGEEANRYPARTLYGGIGLAAAGVLLTTIWSDVPVVNAMTYEHRAGGGVVQSSIGW